MTVLGLCPIVDFKRHIPLSLSNSSNCTPTGVSRHLHAHSSRIYMSTITEKQRFSTLKIKMCARTHGKIYQYFPITPFKLKIETSAVLKIDAVVIAWSGFMRRKSLYKSRKCSL